MTVRDFEDCVAEQMARCSDLLTAKGHEYAPGADRLAAFKKAAALQACTPAEAALGMLVKHLVSVTDMIQSRNRYTISKWDEKITDSINYLLIIRAIIEEQEAERE